MRKLRTAEIGDAVIAYPQSKPHVAIFTTEFSFYSNLTHIQGVLVTCRPETDRNAFQTALAKLPVLQRVVLIENDGLIDCSCADHKDINEIEVGAAGVIVNGALRNSAMFTKFRMPVLARSVNPLPFAAQQESGNGRSADLEPFPFAAGGYIVADPDGVVVFRSFDVLLSMKLDIA
jgi:regulator of RNase E activity RraA